MRGGNLFPNQLPGMDMIKQDGDATRVRDDIWRHKEATGL